MGIPLLSLCAHINKCITGHHWEQSGSIFTVFTNSHIWKIPLSFFPPGQTIPFLWALPCMTDTQIPALFLCSFIGVSIMPVSLLSGWEQSPGALLWWLHGLQGHFAGSWLAWCPPRHPGALESCFPLSLSCKAALFAKSASNPNLIFYLL